ncbi:hypothetical protein HUU39_11200 [candidate division KSB1 bacterium]|nr:hypothetical protein [candidate division KSB1 bacterium]
MVALVSFQSFSGRGNFQVEHGVRCAGCLALGGVIFTLGSEVTANLFTMSQVIGDGTINLLHRENGKRLGNALRGLAVQEGVNDGIERDAGGPDPITVVALFNASGIHGKSPSVCVVLSEE